MPDINFDKVFEDILSMALGDEKSQVNGTKFQKKQLDENNALIMAKNIKIAFDAFIKVGFTETQTLLIMQMAFNAIRGGN